MLVLINLSSATSRRQHMKTQLDAQRLGYATVGIDLRGCSCEEAGRIAARHAPNVRFDFAALSTAEVGCWLSHLGAWKAMLANVQETACTVIEDDLLLAADFAEVVAKLEGFDTYDVIYLGTSSRNLSSRRTMRIGALSVHEPVGAIFNTWGYAISRDYAARVLAIDRLRIKKPIDHFLGGRGSKFTPRVAVLQPPAVEEDPSLGADSQIEPYTHRIDRWRVVEKVRRKLLSSQVSDLYYSLYRFF